jgi:hypothetical protein
MTDVPEISCFSKNYSDGMQRFRQAGAMSEADMETRIHPHSLTPDGQPLEQDIAWFGAKDAPKVLLVSAGTHGLEAFAGSAAMIHWMQSGHWRELPPDTAVCMVHTVNPFGWAHLSRFNENFVDVNRNFIDHSESYPPNPLYEEILALFETDSVSDDELVRGWFRFRDYLVNHNDPALVIQCATGGQYQDPTGPSFGGHQYEWSTLSLIDLIDARLTQARTVVHIDWHTGLGRFGQPAFVIGAHPDSPAFALACTVWGRDALTPDDLFEANAGTPEYRGLIHSGLIEHLERSGVRATGTVIEFGTYANPTMNAALFIDRWLRQQCDSPDSETARSARQTILERFNPSAIEWRSAVLSHSAALMQRTLESISTLHT